MEPKWSPKVEKIESGNSKRNFTKQDATQTPPELQKEAKMEPKWSPNGALGAPICSQNGARMPTLEDKI